MAAKSDKYIMHFGIRVDATRPTARINRDTYTQVSERPSIYNYHEAKYHIEHFKSAFLLLDEATQSVSYTEDHCNLLRDRALSNFDINMQKFALLDTSDFEDVLRKFTRRRHFSEIANLNDAAWSDPCELGIDGYLYIMVLGQYKQVYIGMTRSALKTRILQHWRKRKPLDRLVWGSLDVSPISIDSFGSLDTTHIYAKPVVENFLGYLDLTEHRYIHAYDQRYILNRL